MPLHILGALVVIGIGSVVMLVHLLKMSRAEGFADEDAVRAVFSIDFPGAAPGEVTLADDGRAAVLTTDGGVGLVVRFGAGRLTRLLRPGDLKSVEERTAALRLRLADYGAPRIDFACADDDKRAEIKRLLENAR